MLAFEAAAAKFPNRTAVSGLDGDLSYTELNTKADKLAALLQQHGVQPNELVALTLERNTDLLVGVLGILKAGAAYLPIDLSYPKDRLAFMLEDSGARIMLAHKHLTLPEHGGTTLYMEDVPWDALSRGKTPSHYDLAYVI